MAEPQQIHLRIEGMTCPSCAQHVAGALESVPGVVQAEVLGWQSGQVLVFTKEDVPQLQLIDAVKNAGYSAVMEEPISAVAPIDEDSNVDFDLLVIGGGSGGFAAAIAASEAGKRVGLINAGVLGGTCVNIGCIPSKTLIRAAEAWYKAAHHPFRGVETTQGKLDWSMLRAEKDALVTSLRQSKYIDVLTAYPEIRFIEGYAAFQADGAVRVSEHAYCASRYLIATGAQPRQIPFPGVQEVQPLNSTTLMELDTLPQSLIILGGRAIALEMAQLMARLGVEVLILQRSARLIPDHEPEISQAIQSYLEQEGIRIITSVQVERVSREGESRIVDAQVMGQSQQFRAEQLLMALGRQPNTSGLGLEHVNVSVDETGAIIVDDYQQTTNPRIYATGDVTTRPEYVYVAAAGGSLSAHNAFNPVPKAFDLSAMPSVIFTDPQIATVGLTEAEARHAGYIIQVSTIGLEHVARAQAARDLRGMVKLIANAESGRLLGAHVMAAEGGEVIQAATLAIRFGLTIDNLTSTLFPYLTQGEALKLAALAFSKDIEKLSCCAA